MLVSGNGLHCYSSCESKPRVCAGFAVYLLGIGASRRQ